jgi:HK97 family phage portal protein
MALADDIFGAAAAALSAAGNRLAKASGNGDDDDRHGLPGDDEDVPFEAMQDALVSSGLAEPTEGKPRGLFHDPYSVADWGGWRQRPTSLTYETLRQMALTPIIAAIIQLRVDQVAQFAVPQQGPYDHGYKIVLRDRRDKNRSMTEEEQTQATELERMIETTGYMLEGEKNYDRDNFRQFLKKIVRDCLVYDQTCVEVIRDRKGRPSRFLTLPAETIRPAVLDSEHMDPAEKRSRVAYVQVYEDTVIAEFSADDLAWGIKNPRSDLRVNGFGFSPIEQMVRLVTAWLYGFEYNQNFFKQGSAIKGLINIKGAIPDRQMRAFRRQWYTMISGVQNAFKTPILNADEIQWHPMHQSNRDMEYGQWMDWLTKIVCSLFGVDPVEINFVFSSSGSGGAMFDRRPNEAEVSESKDKGLRPLIEFIEDYINQHIVWELAPSLEFQFTGLDSKSEQKEREARIAEVRAVKTVNQIRAEMDEPPLEGKLGEVILDPTWLQWASQLQAQEQQAQQAAQPQPGQPQGPMPGSTPQGTPENPTGEPPPPEEQAPPDQGAAPQGEALAASLALTRTVGELRKSLDGDMQILEIEVGG